MRRSEGTCIESNCSRPITARGLCAYHYNFRLVHNMTLPPKAKSHGHTRNGMSSAEYTSWANMISRCENPKQNCYERYGGRGISVCARWHRFDLFLEDMGLKPTSGHTIERVDNDGNYEPGNCRWATSYEQRRNTRRNHYLLFSGRMVTISDASQERGMNPRTVRSRLNRGLSPGEALSLPITPMPSQRTHCPKGHPYQGRNLSLTASGSRYCRICKSEWNKSSRRARMLLEV